MQTCVSLYKRANESCADCRSTTSTGSLRTMQVRRLLHLACLGSLAQPAACCTLRAVGHVKYLVMHLGRSALLLSA